MTSKGTTPSQKSKTGGDIIPLDGMIRFARSMERQRKLLLQIARSEEGKVLLPVLRSAIQTKLLSVVEGEPDEK